MKALVFDGELKLTECEKPIPKPGEALVRVRLAGICNTDHEITRGYAKDKANKNFSGILGHEVVGVVEKINGDDKSLLGKRVVPEINYGCQTCEWCRRKDYRHCPSRYSMGIRGKDGCFAEYFTIPTELLFEVPDSVTDEQAVFAEPLAAAIEITEQQHIKPKDKTLVLGDGKLGIIIALALGAQGIDVTLVGKHQNKLDIAASQGIKTILKNDLKLEKAWDIVVEATGASSGLETALALVKSLGVIVLKTTTASEMNLNLSAVVVNEITLLGSRCGPFEPAVRLLKAGKLDFAPMISEIFNADKAVEAFEKSKEKGVLKVLLRFSED